MSDSAAIICTFVSVKTMADGAPRITLEASCSLSELAALGLSPGAPFGLVRLEPAAATKALSQPEPPKEKVGELCIMACNFCADPVFRAWVDMSFRNWLARDGIEVPTCTESEAKVFILELCGVESRKALDSNAGAARIFMEEIRGPFMAHKASLNKAR